jgi:hypothetical protein
MMILTENADDPVAEACAAFVCAAAESAEGYTIEQLTEMVNDLILSEVGGLMSWLGANFTGMARGFPAEVRAEILKIKTQEDKDRALKDIDNYIVLAREPKTTVEKLITMMKNGVPGVLALKVGTKAKIEVYREALAKVRKEVTAVKIKKTRN